MTRKIVLAVLVAGLAMVLFAERLGIPAALASLLVLSLLGAAVVLTAVLSGTSRLPLFLIGEGAAGWLALVGRHAILSAGGLLMLAVTAPLQASGILVVMVAYLAGVALCPRHAIEVKTQGIIPPGLRPDEARLLSLSIGLIAAVAVVALGPEVLRLVGGTLARPFIEIAGLTLGLTAILLLPGGDRGVLRFVAMGLTLAIFFIFLPFLLETLRDAAEWRSILQDPVQRAGWQALLPGFAFQWADVPLPAVIGMALGLVGAAGHAQVEGRLKRCLAPVFGILVLCLTIALIASSLLMLERVLNLSIAGVLPQRWPLFVFDESLRSWISVCGQVPSDPLDVIEACRTAGRDLPLQRGDIRLDPELRAPAIAAARAMPTMLGVIWLGIGLLLLLTLEMLLLSAAATAISEVLLFRVFHPRGLKAWRLVAARVSILALAAGAILLTRAGYLSGQALLFFAIGALLLVGFVLVAHHLRRIVGWWNTRRIQLWPQPANENAAMTPEALPMPVAPVENAPGKNAQAGKVQAENVQS